LPEPRSEMPSEAKVERVKGLSERLTAADAALLTDYRGLTVHEADELRTALAEADARFSVVKNSLTRLAMKQAGMEGLAELIDGPTAIAFVHGDPVAAAKALVDAARRYPVLEVRGGFAEGRVLTAEEIREYAALDSREVMLAKIAGLGKMQLARTALMLQALQVKFVRLMEALRDELPEQETAEPQEAPQPEETETEPAPTETETEPAPDEAGSEEEGGT
jgi:large subunit ribosomal protein L10